MKIDTICRHCGRKESREIISSVDAVASPELKEKVRSGELFRWNCPECGKDNLLTYPFLYHDSSQKLILLVSESRELPTDTVPDGYCSRLVAGPGELIEKIMISEAGLDDVVLELCKMITLQEMGKDFALKFFRIDGADSEIVFTYPDGAQMQMLAVGLNVYEDCAGIVQRNSSISERAKALLRVDQEWISQFFA